MVKQIVIKVSYISCQLCKTDVLKAVTKLEGIDEVKIDGEKGMLTVVGEVDPVLIIKRLRKIKKGADIVSVGPKKPPEPKPNPVCLLPPYCKSYHSQPVFAVPVGYDDGYGWCTIL